MSLESLTNKGIVVAKPQTNQTQKTLIVVGVARGGTSIVSGTLHHLGVFMGNAHAPVYEDLRLSLAFEKQSKEKFETVIDHYNQQHEVWAWKRPSTLHALVKIARKVRNPHFVFVFRDMLSVANRNTISMHKDIAWGLKSALDDYSKIIKFINRTKHPALLISSEKVVKHKSDFVDALTRFSGTTPTGDQVQAAQAFLSPNPTAYIEATRLTKAKGGVDKALLRTGVLKGWACYVVNHSEVQVEVVVNGKVVATLNANQFEKQYKKPGGHPTGYCGFEYDLKTLGVQPCDSIEVKVKGDVVNLHNEPLDYSALKAWLSPEAQGVWVEPKGAVNINLLQTGVLRGWARTSDFNQPALIGIYINGDLLAQVPATIYREPFYKQGIHPTGRCGYEFNLKQHGVSPKDSLEVKLENAKCQLHLEPISFPGLDNWLTHQDLQEKNRKANNATG